LHIPHGAGANHSTDNTGDTNDKSLNHFQPIKSEV
jgi:hypothetical protein